MIDERCLASSRPLYLDRTEAPARANDEASHRVSMVLSTCAAVSDSTSDDIGDKPVQFSSVRAAHASDATHGWLGNAHGMLFRWSAPELSGVLLFSEDY